MVVEDAIAVEVAVETAAVEVEEGRTVGVPVFVAVGATSVNVAEATTGVSVGIELAVGVGVGEMVQLWRGDILLRGVMAAPTMIVKSLMLSSVSIQPWPLRSAEAVMLSAPTGPMPS